MDSSDQRHGVRHRIDFETVYSAGREEGVGVLVDISTTGALIEDATLQPKLGSHVHLHLLLYGDQGPVQMHGKVIRHTLSGFALQITRWIPPEGLEL